MIEFKNKIVQLGFGAVGKSFFEKVFKEIKFDIDKYFVISSNQLEYTFFLEMGGKIGNFIVADIRRKNFEQIFSDNLSEGDLLIDFTDGVGTREFVDWCANHNVMYINTGETDWDDNWYNIFDENVKKNDLRLDVKRNKNINKYPIVLQHGNNPGLVSHFVKAGLEYVIKTQFKKDKKLQDLLKDNKFNEIAKELDLKEIHVNDNDYQEIDDIFEADKLYSTWSVDSFFFEMLSESTANMGTSENISNKYNYKKIDEEKGFLEFNDLAINITGKTYYPKGKFEGFLVPHEETITISNYLEVKENEKVIYRPTVIFLYSPCDYAIRYLKNAKTSDNIEISQDRNNPIVRGFKYPKKYEILYREKIKKGTEYVGVLLLGTKFNPVWVGNRIEKKFLYRNKKHSYWQTPTITPVSMSALAATCWMIKNQERGGIYFPDDIEDYKYIIKFAEKYISKTIYKTFKKDKIEKELDIKLENLQLTDILINKKEE